MAGVEPVNVGVFYDPRTARTVPIRTIRANVVDG